MSSFCDFFTSDFDSVLKKLEKLQKDLEQGKLESTANTENESSNDKKVLNIVNKIVKIFTDHFKETGEYIEKIGKGDMPKAHISNDYKGDFSKIKTGLNSTLKQLKKLDEDLKSLLKKHIAKEYHDSLDENAPGIYNEIRKAVNKLVKIHSDNLCNLKKVLEGYSRCDFNDIYNRINFFTNNIKELAHEINTAYDAVKNNDLTVRIDDTKFKDEPYEIASNVNSIIEAAEGMVVQKEKQCKSYLNSIPFPLIITNKNRKITFLNTKAEKIFEKKNESTVGKDCCEIGLSICKTENCGIEVLHDGKNKTQYEDKKNKRFYTIYTLYIKDENGEKQCHIEIFYDSTELESLKSYETIESKRLAENLKRLSNGNLNFESCKEGADDYTIESYENFSRINDHLETTGKRIEKLSHNIAQNSQDILRGQFEIVFDPQEYEGVFYNMAKSQKQSVDFITTCLDSIPITVFIADNNSKIQYINKRGLKFFNKEKIDDMVNTTCCDHLDFAGCRNSNCIAKKIIRHDKPISEETEIKIGGETLKVVCHGSPIKDLNNNAQGVIISIIKEDETKYIEQINSHEQNLQKQKDFFQKETNRIERNLKRLSEGQIANDNQTTSTDKDTEFISMGIEKIDSQISEISSKITSLIKEVCIISEAIEQGDLNRGINYSSYKGQFRKLFECLDQIRSSILSKISIISEGLREISEGNTSAQLKDNFKGNFSEINDRTTQIIAYLKGIENIVEKITNGNIAQTITKKSDKDSLAEAILLMMQMLQKKIDSVGKISEDLDSEYSEINRASQALRQKISKQTLRIDDLKSFKVKMTDTLNKTADYLDDNLRDYDKSISYLAEFFDPLDQSADSIDEIRYNSEKIVEIAKKLNTIGLHVDLEVHKDGDHLKKLLATMVNKVKVLAESLQDIGKTIEKLSNKSGEKTKRVQHRLESVKPAIENISEKARNLKRSSATQLESTKKVENVIKELELILTENSDSLETIKTAQEGLISLSEKIRDISNHFR